MFFNDDTRLILLWKMMQNCYPSRAKDGR